MARDRSKGHPDSSEVTAGLAADSQARTRVGRSVPEPADGACFVPGAIVDARYRIVGLIGSGGMGEVYRADDLRLGQPVALKFLPHALVDNAAALARFHREVKNARQITHKNVVRVHDIGEADGRPFLSMEYVDGENLAGLLKRIGRLPQDKGLELARQLCAGLAAAHDQGVIHRDLKPANILIDGQGRAKITDLGLAELAGDLKMGEIVGTPAYMAPEQLAEGKVTMASDLYSLGLVLYEMFSGKRAFSAASRTELMRAHREELPSSMSACVTNLDPAIEQAVLRCLARQPEQRFESALSLAAALPGGDPLAAALVAGETPSPEMVAGAGVKGAVSMRAGLAMLGVTLLGVAAWVALSYPYSILALDTVPLKPEVLAHQARGLLEQAGQGKYPSDEWEFRVHPLYLLKLSGQTMPAAEWLRIAGQRPPPMEFWFRAGPAGMSPIPSGRLFNDDPPLTTPGTATVRLDSRGRLLELLAVPEGGRPPSQEGVNWDWLFQAAKLEQERFSRTETGYAPPVYADETAVWEGTYPGQQEKIAVEAAARSGRIVHWRVRRASLAEQAGQPPPAGISFLAVQIVVVAILILGSWLARRNLKSGRTDRLGANRLAAAIVAAYILQPVSFSGAAILRGGLSPLFQILAEGLLIGALIWVAYLAVEPSLRRVIPERMISWSRLISGRWSDPLVGRDFLLGMAGASAAVAVLGIYFYLDWRSDEAWVRVAYGHGLRPLLGIVPTLANLAHYMVLVVPICLMFLLLVPHFLLRRRWAADIVGGLAVLGFGWAAVGVLPTVAVVGLSLISIARIAGPVGLMGFQLVIVNLFLVPVTWDASAWWAPVSWLSAAGPALMAAQAFRVATASR